jgi:hypothetical protein
MPPRTVLRQYVQGVGQVSGQPQSYLSTWQYDVTVTCPFCRYTVRATTWHNQPSVELIIEDQDLQPGCVQRTVMFYLRDSQTGYNLYSYQHSCSGGGMVAGGGLNVSSGYSDSSFAQVDMVGWMAKIEQKLDVRFAQEEELARLAGLVPLLTERLAMAKQEAETANRKNVELTIQIQLIHQSLDCPCEHDFLTENLDLVGHMSEIGISFSD